MIYDALVATLALILVRDEILVVFADDITIVVCYFMRMRFFLAVLEDFEKAANIKMHRMKTSSRSVSARCGVMGLQATGGVSFHL